MGVSEYNEACRKLFRWYVISCPFASRFSVHFTEAFASGFVDEWWMLPKEVTCDPG